MVVVLGRPYTSGLTDTMPLPLSYIPNSPSPSPHTFPLTGAEFYVAQVSLKDYAGEGDLELLTLLISSPPPPPTLPRLSCAKDETQGLMLAKHKSYQLGCISNLSPSLNQ